MQKNTYFHGVPVDILEMVNRRVYNPTIVLMGGLDEEGDDIEKQYRYDTINNVWSSEYSFYTFGHGSFCVDSESRTMFMCGGSDQYKSKGTIFCSYGLRDGFKRYAPIQGTIHNSLCILDGVYYNWDENGITTYNKVNGSWSDRTKNIYGRTYHTSVSVGHDIITFGGMAAGHKQATPLLYDTVRGTVRELLDEPYKRMCHTSVYSKEKGCVYSYGGYNKSNNVISDFIMYDIRTESAMDLKADRPSKDGRLIITGEHSVALFGGVLKYDFTYACSDTQVYDMRADEWEHRPEMNSPIKCYSMAIGLL